MLWHRPGPTGADGFAALGMGLNAAATALLVPGVAWSGWAGARA